MKGILWTALALIIIVFCVVGFFAVGNWKAQQQTGAPEYIKEIVSYKEGTDGIMVYFILSDTQGRMTKADGDLTLEIYESTHEFDSNNNLVPKDTLLYTSHIGVYKAMFTKTKVGMGDFQHDALIFTIGRIAYSSFNKPVTQPTGKITIKLMMPDKTLTGTESVIF